MFLDLAERGAGKLFNGDEAVCAILLVALVCGLGFAHVLEAPAKMAYPARLYLERHRSLYVQWGPPQMGGFLEPLAIGVTGLLTFVLWQRKLVFRFPLVAFFASLLAFPWVSFLLDAPANAAIRAATLPAFPAD